jgi:hypothetical protein
LPQGATYPAGGPSCDWCALPAWQGSQHTRGHLFSTAPYTPYGSELFEVDRGNMADELFHPGILVPESGVYQVLHYRHRLYHEVTLLRAASFPSCSECGSNVRFRLCGRPP